MKWIGVDLDGTLAHYESGQGIETIGPPVPAMVARVRRWLESGQEVRIVTARASGPCKAWQVVLIRDWCEAHVGARLFVTDRKDHHMVALYDDRAVSVEKNTGVLLSSPHDGVDS